MAEPSEVCPGCGLPPGLHEDCQKEELNRQWNERLQQEMWAEYEQAEREAGRI